MSTKFPKELAIESLAEIREEWRTVPTPLGFFANEHMIQIFYGYSFCNNERWQTDDVVTINRSNQSKEVWDKYIKNMRFFCVSTSYMRTLLDLCDNIVDAQLGARVWSPTTVKSRSPWHELRLEKELSQAQGHIKKLQDKLAKYE